MTFQGLKQSGICISILFFINASVLSKFICWQENTGLIYSVLWRI